MMAPHISIYFRNSITCHHDLHTSSHLLSSATHFLTTTTTTHTVTVLTLSLTTTPLPLPQVLLEAAIVSAVHMSRSPPQVYLVGSPRAFEKLQIALDNGDVADLLRTNVTLCE